MTLQVDAKCRQYANRIKNANKRAYALAIIANNGVSEGVDRGSLSYMAAQAVRMQLAEIIKG